MSLPLFLSSPCPPTTTVTPERPPIWGRKRVRCRVFHVRSDFLQVTEIENFWSAKPQSQFRASLLCSLPSRLREKGSSHPTIKRPVVCPCLFTTWPAERGRGGCESVQMRLHVLCVRAHACVHVELSDSVRECVMEGSQASWLLFSWRKSTKNKNTGREVRRDQSFRLESQNCRLRLGRWLPYHRCW